MRKKLWITALAAALLLIVWCGTAAADTNGTCGDHLNWTLSTATGTLAISGTGPMWDFEDDSPFAYDQSITSVILCEGVTTVGDYAFVGCYNLADVSFPSTLTDIGVMSFYHCAIGSLTFPEGLETIGSGAFDANSNLDNVVIPDGVTVIEDAVFRSCSGLTNITLHDGVTAIRREAFYECTALSAIRIPEGVTEIGTSCFYHCKKLSSVILPESVITIGPDAFRYCLQLTGVLVRRADTAIGNDAFGGCSSDLIITGWDDSTAKTYANAAGIPFVAGCGRLGDDVVWGMNTASGELVVSGSGPMWNYDTSTWSPLRGNEIITSVVIGEGITTVGSEVFEDCTKITSVSFPSTLTGIGSYAFTRCKSLENAEIPSGVTALEEGVFSSCFSLKRVVIPDGVLSIGAKAFYDCGDLTSVHLPDGVTTIGNFAFYTCVSLDDPFYIPSSVTTVGAFAFQYCSGLPAAVIYGSGTVVQPRAFEGCASGFKIYGWAPSSAKTYADNNGIPFVTVCGYCGDDAVWEMDPFSGYFTVSGSGPMWDYLDVENPVWWDYRDDITRVMIGSGITTVGGCTFAFARNLEILRLPDTLEAIAADAFYGCGMLPGVTIPAGVQSIGEAAFRECVSLDRIVIPDSVTYLGPSAFYGCTSAVSATIPGSVSIIRSYAFEECTGLASLTIGSGIQEIWLKAFSGCSSLTTVYLPESVTQIGREAFENCGLEHVGICNFSASFGSDVFVGHTLDLIMHGWPGSTAETYADGEGICFEAWPVSGPCGDNASFSFDPATGALSVSGQGAMWDFESINDVPWEMARSIITSVSVGRSIIAVGARAFADCPKLSSVSLDRTVLFLGEAAFYRCGALTGITLPANLLSIGQSAFMRTGLTDITIPANVTSLGLRAFGGCVSLHEITFMGGAPEFANLVFLNVTAVAVYPAGEASWTDSVMLDYGGSITWKPSVEPDFFLPAILTVIEENAFSGVSARAVVIPNSVTSISGNPFADSSVAYIFGWAGSAAEDLALNYPDQFTFIEIDDAWMAAQ